MHWWFSDYEFAASVGETACDTRTVPCFFHNILLILFWLCWVDNSHHPARSFITNITQEIHPGFNSLLWSIPNMIPLPLPEIEWIWQRIEPFVWEETYGAFHGWDISGKGKEYESKDAGEYEDPSTEWRVWQAPWFRVRDAGREYETEGSMNFLIAWAVSYY
jgi:hypothetical protein